MLHINRDAFIKYCADLVAKSYDEALRLNNAEVIAVESHAEGAGLAFDVFEGLAEGLRASLAMEAQASAN